MRKIRIQYAQATRMIYERVLLTLIGIVISPLCQADPYPWWNCTEVIATTPQMTVQVPEIVFVGRFVSNEYLPETTISLESAVLECVTTEDGWLTYSFGTWENLDYYMPEIQIGPNADFYHTLFVVRRTGPVKQGTYWFHLNTSGGHCIDSHTTQACCGFEVPLPVVPEPSSLVALLWAMIAATLGLFKRRESLLITATGKCLLER